MRSISERLSDKYLASETRRLARERKKRIKAMSEKLYWATSRAMSIRHPNSGKWTKAETQRSWDHWEQEVAKIMAIIDGE